MKQRIIRGTAVYLHIFGNSERRGRIKDLLFLQPLAVVATLMTLLTLGMISRGVQVVSGTIISAFIALVLIEGYRCSKSPRDFTPVTVLICLGNLLIVPGFFMQMLRIKPQLTSFDRNDC